MINKKRVSIFVASGVLLVVITFFSISYFIDNKYRNQLPELPDLSNASSMLKEQITSSQKDALQSPNSENLGMLGLVYYSSNYYSEASQCLELAAKRESSDWKWNYYLGYLKIELGQSEGAIDCFKKVTDINPDVTLAWYHMADIYQQIGSAKEAEKILNKLISRRPIDFRISSKFRTSYFLLPIYAKLLLAKIHMSNNDLDQAEKILKEIVNEEATFGSAYKQLGVLYKQKGDSVRSEKYTLRSNDLIVYNFPIDTLIDKVALNSRSYVFMLKELDNAIRGTDSRWTIELISRALKNIPDNKYILSKVVKQCLSMGVGKLILPYLDQHFDFYKDDHMELAQVGTSLADAGFKEQAKKYFVRAKNISGQTPESFSTLAGLFFEKLGMNEQARQLMKEVIEKNPKNETVLGDGIFLFLNTGDLDTAKKYFYQLKKISPSNANVKLFSGIMAENDGDIKQAIRFYEESFKANPKKKFLINHLGTIYLNNKMWAKTIDFFRKALVAYPNDSYLQERLGSLLITSPDENLINLQEGLEYSERAYYNSKYSTSTKISSGRTLAIAHYRLGNIPKARYFIDQTIKAAGKANSSPAYIRELQTLANQIDSSN